MKDLWMLVNQAVERRVASLRVAVELVHDVVWGERGGEGKGLQDRPLQGDYAGLYGFYSRPPDGGEGVVLKLGGKGDSAIFIGTRHRQYEVTLAKGELLIRDERGAEIRFKDDGIHIDAAKVVIRGGTKEAARKDDPVRIDHAFKVWCNGVSAATGVPVFVPTTIGQVDAGAAEVLV